MTSVMLLFSAKKSWWDVSNNSLLDSKLSQSVSPISVYIWILICMNSDPLRLPYGRGNLRFRLFFIYVFLFIYLLTKSDRWIYAMTQQPLPKKKIKHVTWNILKVYVLFVSLTIHNYMYSCSFSFVFSIFSAVLWSELTCDPPVVNDFIGSLTCAFTLWVIYCPQGHRVNAGWYPLADDWRYV